jgi:hypothetical protein
MTIQSLISRVRLLINDIDNTNVILAVKKGIFWSNDEILNVLNASQYAFIDFCLNGKIYYPLNNIYTYSIFLDANLSINNDYDLPADYLHYASAKYNYNHANLSQLPIYYPSKIYLGGEGLPFLSCYQDAAVILNNKIRFKVNDEYCGGMLFYYKHPASISSVDVYSFDDLVYSNIICIYAAIILGMKQIQTGREYKTYQTLAKQFTDLINNYQNYTEDREFINEFKTTPRVGQNTVQNQNQ